MAAAGADLGLRPTDAGPVAVDAATAPRSDADPGVDAVTALFRPRPGTTWQWQLTGLPVDQSVDVQMYDVDLFTTTVAEIAQLHAKGRVVICYFSAGSWEKFRPDSGQYPANVLGAPLAPPFQDERWLDIRSAVVRMIVGTRLDLAMTKRCDGVEPDNVDGFDNKNGLNLTAADQLNFNRFVATEAHRRGLSVGLKNDLQQLDALLGDFDWALNEECVKYSECASYSKTFIAAGKAVFHAEYVAAAERDRVCAVTVPLKLGTIIKKIGLDAFRVACP